MEPDRWQQVADLYGEALELPASDRAGLLRARCGEDQTLRAEVESLLSMEGKPGLLDSTIVSDECKPSAVIGGRFRIVQFLGRGGMGEVYKAEDLQMGGYVALKNVRPELLHDFQAAERFKREIQLAKKVTHPNVCRIFDVGFHPSPSDPDAKIFLTMELLEGQTLSSRLAAGPMSKAESFPLIQQMADALGAAHRAGVVHRDFKTGNVMLVPRPAGSQAVVMDFGLAKQLAVLDTALTDGTQPGMVLGTIQYMSPEQLQGKEVDARSDIFSFGLVLYEMLTGLHPFESDSAAGVMAGILEREPPPLEPNELNRVVKACLAKNPDDRFQSARDLKRAMEWSVSGDAAVPKVPRTSKRWMPWAAAALVLALAFLVWLRTGSMATAPTRMALTIVPPSGSPLMPAGQSTSAPEISPDGSSVLYAASDGLWVRRLDSLEPTLLRGSQGYSNSPFWSADSKAIVFPALGDLVRIPVPDGAPELISKIPSYERGGTWSDGNTILISSGDKLYSLPASRREPKLVDMPGMKRGIYRYPQFLPGGEDFLFLLAPNVAEEGEIYLATLRDGKGINPSLLMKNDTNAYYTPAGGGRILFVRNDNLYSQRLNPKRRQLEGDPELVQRGVASGPESTVRHADFSVSRSGVVAWRPGRAALNQVTIFDRRGKEIGTAGPLGLVHSVALSPDETRLLAFGGGSWLLSPGQSGSLLLESGAWKLWSPDGSRLIGFVAPRRLAERSVDGSGEVREFGAPPGFLDDISPDGKQVLIRSGSDIVASRLGETVQKRTPEVIVHTGEVVFGSGFSPEGKWILYAVQGKRNGPSGIYVQPFPGPGLRTQIASIEGFPVWRKDGKEIVFVNPKGVWSVRVDPAGGGYRFGTPELLFSGLRWPAGHTMSSWPLAVSRDGSRFYFPQAVAQPDSGVIHVAMGWANK